MSFKDFLYFQKGERHALMIILALITIAAILLIVNRKPEIKTEYITQQSENKQIEDTTIQQQNNITTLPSSSQQIYSKSKEKPEQKNYIKPKESTKERIERMSNSGRNNYSKYPKNEKFKAGIIIELNTADTTTLKKIPGIGSSFAKRIIKYRELLGGYYSVTQLSEIYGMDEERYSTIAPWFKTDESLIKKLNVNNLDFSDMLRHPYLNKEQVKIITKLRSQKGKLTGWENLQLLDEFTDSDKERLKHYLTFE